MHLTVFNRGSNLDLTLVLKESGFSSDNAGPLTFDPCSEIIGPDAGSNHDRDPDQGSEHFLIRAPSRIRIWVQPVRGIRNAI